MKEPLLSILTVYTKHDPFLEIQEKNLRDFTKCSYEHHTVEGDMRGSYAHGEALDKLMKKARGEYIVTLDSDAFPVRKEWDRLVFDRMEKFNKTSHAIPIVGIYFPVWHDGRGVIHPSFAIFPRELITDLSFQRVGKKYDTGMKLYERVTERNAVPLPMFEMSCNYSHSSNVNKPGIGALYGFADSMRPIIFHHWYTSRIHSQAKDGTLDGDIPVYQIEDSIQMTLKKYS